MTGPQGIDALFDCLDGHGAVRKAKMRSSTASTLLMTGRQGKDALFDCLEVVGDKAARPKMRSPTATTLLMTGRQGDDALPDCLDARGSVRKAKMRSSTASTLW